MENKKHKILFVFHGNICRSPMAEFVMKDIVNKAGMTDRFVIESAATSTEEIGEPVYPPVRKLLSQHGIDCSMKRARLVTRSDYDYFSYIFVMDNNNLRNIRRIIPNDTDHKISMLMDYTDTPKDIADPWYTGNFDLTWEEVNEGCKRLLEGVM